MRLLNAETLAFENFLDSNLPPFAILSHTWVEEVTFQTVHDPEVANTPGYLKIKNCCDQALKRNLRYVWVDSCCIDKTNHVELMESINSMYSWYAYATVCFAYLQDVPKDPDLDGADSPFAKSRWFTRGWTLQELLAPKVVIFFSQEWDVIASRAELATRIQEVSGIDQCFLQDKDVASRGYSLGKASVAERMSWAAKRQTTRPEDLAYCLLGIFDVSMPIIYGEGMAAFTRLQQVIIQRSFDPTILAWKTGVHDSNTQSLKLDLHVWETTPSFWDSATGLLQTDYPWMCKDDTNKASEAPTTLLAPSPECFEGCQDIVPCDVNLDWNVSVSRLSILLPRSVDDNPYAVLPCRMKRDPFHLLALPMYSCGGGIYSRCNYPAMWVNHRKWNQWPLSRTNLLLQSHDQMFMPRMPRQSFWLRRVPPDVRVLQVYPPSEEPPSSSNIIPLTRRDGPPQFKDSPFVALLLERHRDDKKFAVMLDMREVNASALLGPFSRWSSSHIVPYELGEDDFPTFAETHREEAKRGNVLNTSYHDDDDGFMAVEIENAHLHGKTIFNIDIWQDLDGVMTDLSKAKWKLATILYVYLDAGRSSYPSVFSTIEHVPLPMVLATYCHRYVLHTFLQAAAPLISPWVRSMPSFNAIDMLLKRYLQLFGLVYRYLPIMSYWTPETTPLIQRHRFPIALGSSMVIWLLISGHLESRLFVYCHTIVCVLVLYSYVNKIPREMEWADATLSWTTMMIVTTFERPPLGLDKISRPGVAIVIAAIFMLSIWGFARGERLGIQKSKELEGQKSDSGELKAEELESKESNGGKLESKELGG